MHCSNLCFRLLCVLAPLALGLLAPAPAPAAPPPPVYYVRTTGSDANSGLSWAAAKKTIQAAINATASPHQVWVARGTYREKLNIQSDLLLYGGFQGNELTTESRTLPPSATTIDADSSDTNRGPAIQLNIQNRNVIDGFRVTQGYFGIQATAAFMSKTSLVVSNCLIEENGEGSGHGLYLTYIQSILISRCKIQMNHSIQGGGLYLYYCGGRIVDSEITDNYAIMGGGAWIQLNYRDPLQIERCVVTANSAYEGGAFYIIDPAYNGLSLKVTDSMICGNSSPDGSAFYLSRPGLPPDGQSMKLELRHCTLADNSTMNSTSGTLSLSPSVSLNLVNSILTSPQNVLIDNGRLSARNCLFQPSAAGIYNIHPSLAAGLPPGATPVCYGAGALNMLAGCSGNIQGDPKFATESSADGHGTWTAPAVYNEQTYKTTLVDDSARFTPGALVGRLIRPYSDWTTTTVVIENTSHTIALWGDCSDPAAAGKTYHILDYHLSSASPAIDRGALADATPADFEGDPRPGSDGKVDIGADEAPASLTPPPLPAESESSPPISRVDPLPAGIPIKATLGVHAFDADSGIDRVQLYYRFNKAGEWHLYATPITTFSKHAGQVVFDATRLNGAGQYEFYAVATDRAGNVETKPARLETRSTLGLESPGGSIILYLLGQTTNPAGLDVNGDGKIDIGDALARDASFKPVPSNPTNGAVNVPHRPSLTWSTAAPAGAGARTYDLYLWNAACTQPAAPTASGLTKPAWMPAAPLNANTQYRWQIVTHVGTWQCPGPIWTFQTTTPSPQ